MTAVAKYDILVSDVDSAWISVSTYLVFFMQAGFAILEAGSIMYYLIIRDLIN